MENNSSIPTVPSEVWFAELCSHHPLVESNSLVSCDGPDDALLRRIAHSKHKPSLTDPRVSHVARCSTCLERLAELRQAEPTVRSKGKAVRILQTCLALASLCAVGISLYRGGRRILTRTTSVSIRKPRASKT